MSGVIIEKTIIGVKKQLRKKSVFCHMQFAKTKDNIVEYHEMNSLTSYKKSVCDCSHQ